MIFIGALAGCAGSATHQVVTAHQSDDELLSCPQIDTEIIKAQVIIDGVNQDKDDMTGSDVVDGLLWFPFNLIAKSSNYSNALEAADERISNLQTLKDKKSCAVASVGDQKAAVSKLTDELNELNNLYKSGALTQEEYIEAKQKVLNSTES